MEQLTILNLDDGIEIKFPDMTVKAMKFNGEIAVDIGPQDYRVYRFMAAKIELHFRDTMVLVGDEPEHNYKLLLDVLRLTIDRCTVSAGGTIAFTFVDSEIELRVPPDPDWNESWRFFSHHDDSFSAESFIGKGFAYQLGPRARPVLFQ